MEINPVICEKKESKKQRKIKTNTITIMSYDD